MLFSLKNIIFYICLFLLSTNIFSQNLILNPSFEQIWVCPHSWVTEPNSKPFPEWINPNNGTVDVLNFCSDYNAGVPQNYAGFLMPHEGNGYAGIVLWEKFFSSRKVYDFNAREYIQTKFTQPLKRNKLYCIKFYFANAQKTLYSVDALGVAITKEKITAKRGSLIIQRPQLINKPGNILDNTEWEEFAAIYRAKGKEEFLTIGNFFDNNQTKYKLNDRQKLDSTLIYAYYFIDDVSVFEIENAFECACNNKNILGYDPFADDFDKQIGYNINNGMDDFYNKDTTKNIKSTVSGEQNSQEDATKEVKEKLQHLIHTSLILMEKAQFDKDLVRQTLLEITNENNNKLFSKQSVDFAEKSLKSLSGENANIDVIRMALLSADDNIEDKTTENPLLVQKSQITDDAFEKANIGDKFLLNRIFFEFNSAELLDISSFELDNLYDVLQKQINLKIEIRGHTDNIGNEQYNKKLSVNRAASVYNYLISKGIDKTRMKYRGFGTTVAIADNNTETGRAKNRRVEILIMEK